MTKNPTPLSSRELTDLFVAKALAYQGHRAQANMVSGFGERVGYGSNPWSGSFIDVVAREAGLTQDNLPAMVYTPAALAEFTRWNALHTRPRKGDIVFFAFPGEGARSMFDMMHVGIVTDASLLASTGMFQCIEAQTGTGLPRGNQDPTGVYLRVRSEQDVLTFARPRYRARKTLNNLFRVRVPGDNPGTTGIQTLSLAQLTTGRPNRATEILQLALASRVNLTGYKPGTLDPATRAGIAHFQRAIGRVGKDATGQLDGYTLERLAHDTGLFQVTGR
jgi:hypothetical protein